MKHDYLVARQKISGGFMRRQTSVSRENGFSVIEVMISLVILAVGLTAMAQLHRGNIDGAAFARQSTRGAALAQEKAADLGPLLSAARSGSDKVKEGGIEYERTWTVSEAADGTTRVNVSVDWDGATNPIVLSTVGQLYTPDILPPAAAVAPIVDIFNSVSSSSCKSYDDADDNKGSCSGTLSGKSGMLHKEDD